MKDNKIDEFRNNNPIKHKEIPSLWRKKVQNTEHNHSENPTQHPILTFINLGEARIDQNDPRKTLYH